MDDLAIFNGKCDFPQEETCKGRHFICMSVLLLWTSGPSSNFGDSIISFFILDKDRPLSI